MDDFIAAFDVPAPNHLKVDVDGNEAKIMAGGAVTLARRELKSIVIELDDTREADTHAVVETLVAHGFERIWKRQAPRPAGSPFANTFNWLFRRA